MQIRKKIQGETNFFNILKFVSFESFDVYQAVN